jgi:hypothetical protein
VASKAAIYFINLKDKQLPSVPSTVFNFIASYDSKYFGVNGSYNMSTGIYADATNIIKTPTYHTVNTFKEQPAVGTHQIALIRLPFQFLFIAWAWFIHDRNATSKA